MRMGMGDEISPIGTAQLPQHLEGVAIAHAELFADIRHRHSRPRSSLPRHVRHEAKAALLCSRNQPAIRIRGEFPLRRREEIPSGYPRHHRSVFSDNRSHGIIEEKPTRQFILRPARQRIATALQLCSHPLRAKNPPRRKARLHRLPKPWTQIKGVVSPVSRNQHIRIHQKFAPLLRHTANPAPSRTGYSSPRSAP